MNIYSADLEKGKVALTSKIGEPGLEKTFDLGFAAMVRRQSLILLMQGKDL